VAVAVGLTVFEIEPRTEPTLLSIERIVASPPDKLHDRVAHCPCVIVAVSAVNELIAGAKTGGGGGSLTVILTDFVAVPYLFVAVSLYVAVPAGAIAFEVLPSTLPTPLSIVKLVGAIEPVILHDRVADWPLVITVELEA
jgi:hypothetical protein